jgi:GAF domain-containing protein
MNYQKALREINNVLSGKEEKKLQTVVSYLHDHVDYYSWVGIYLIKDNILQLGPWKGPQATEHKNIPIGKGVCGAAAKTGKTEMVSDVKNDDRYLSCFLSTRSEIVVPIKKNKKIIGEIDIDSDRPAAFTKQDKTFLESVADMLSEHICIN